MKDTGARSDESGAHDVVRTPEEYRRRAADCANHNERIGKIERTMYMLGGAMAVISMFGMFAINSYFTSQNEWKGISVQLLKISGQVETISIDIKDIKEQYREVEKRVGKWRWNLHEWALRNNERGYISSEVMPWK